MKLCHVTIYVKDLDESLHFYENILGLTIKRQFAAGPNTQIVFFDAGTAEVELIYDKTISTINIGKDISLGFNVPSLDKNISELKEKWNLTPSNIIKPNPHIQFCFVSDPNGVNIQFFENID